MEDDLRLHKDPYVGNEGQDVSRVANTADPRYQRLELDNLAGVLDHNLLGLAFLVLLCLLRQVQEEIEQCELCAYAREGLDGLL